MTKLREQIPYSAYEAARAACDAMKAGGSRSSARLLDSLQFLRRERRDDRDDDAVVMTIN